MSGPHAGGGQDDPLHLLSVSEALAEHEQAALLVRLADKEDSGRALARQRLAHALAALASTRELAGELSRAMGRPPLHVLRRPRRRQDGGAGGAVAVAE